MQSTCLVAQAVPALCVGTEYTTLPDGSVDDTQRHVFFASSQPVDGWEIAMRSAEVAAAIQWCHAAVVAGMPVVTWDGARTFRMFAQYPIDAQTRQQLRDVTEGMIDLSVLAAVPEAPAVVAEPATPFPLLDWISGDRDRQLSCVSWSIDYLNTVISAHATVLAADTPAARLCLSPVSELLDQDRLAASMPIEVARATSEDVAERVAWTDDSVFL